MKFLGTIKMKCRSGNGKLLVDLHRPNVKIVIEALIEHAFHGRAMV